MKVSTLLCVSSILHSFVDGNELACITNVTGGTDYFPDKVKPVESKFWSVTYWNTYKIVANTKVGETYLLYQCGTQPPASQLNGSHAAVLSVPLPEVNVLYTTMIPFLEILGERERIAAYLGNMAYVASPCVNKLYDEGKIKEVLNPYNATSIKNIPLNITSFVGTADNTAFETQIRVSDDDEDTNLGTYEWIKFYSLFFNKEQTANEVFSATKARYTCAEENAGLLSCGDEKKPVVLWASYSAYCGGWDVAICPNYYCEFAAACNAKLLSSKTQGSIYSALCFRNYMTTEEFVAFGKDADVWIYTSPGFDTTLANFTGDLANFTSVLNKQVFDTQGSGSDAWFEERLAEPDVVLEDFCSVVGHENVVVSNPRQLVWFRNVFTQAIGNLGQCKNPAAPLVPEVSKCVALPSNYCAAHNNSKPVGGGSSAGSSWTSTLLCALLALATLTFY